MSLLTYLSEVSNLVQSRWCIITRHILNDQHTSVSGGSVHQYILTRQHSLVKQPQGWSLDYSQQNLISPEDLKTAQTHRHKYKDMFYNLYSLDTSKKSLDE